MIRCVYQEFLVNAVKTNQKQGRTGDGVNQEVTAESVRGEVLQFDDSGCEEREDENDMDAHDREQRRKIQSFDQGHTSERCLHKQDSKEKQIIEKRVVQEMLR